MKASRGGSAKRAPSEVDDSAASVPTTAKKKNKTLTLEQQVKQLEDENLALRLQLKVGKESMKQDEQQKDDLVNQIREILSSPEPDKIQLRGLLQSYVVRYSDWSSDHVDAVDNHMVLIKRLLDPTKVTKLCLWTLSQDDDFFKPVLNTNESLYQILCDVIESTLDQVEEFKSYRHNARSLTKGMRFTARECDDLRDRLKRKHRALAEEMHELQDILTPEQLAKFIIWVNKDGELTETLKKEWIGWADPNEEEGKREKEKSSERYEKRSEATSADLGEDDDDGDESE